MNNFLIRNIKDLIKVSNMLDQNGHRKEASYLDSIIRKMSVDLDEILGGPSPAQTSLEDADFNPLDTATEPALELDFGGEDELLDAATEPLEFGSEEMAKSLPNYQEYESLLSGLRESLPSMEPSQLEEILLMVADQVSDE